MSPKLEKSCTSLAGPKSLMLLCSLVAGLRSSYLLLRYRQGWSELWSACPLCFFQSRCGSRETRGSRGSGHSPLGKAPRRWQAWAGWHHGRAASPHIYLDDAAKVTGRIRVLKMY